MQRFTKHLFDITPPHQLLYEYVAGRKPSGWPPYANKYGKFIYEHGFSPAGLVRAQLATEGVFSPGENVEFRRVSCMVLRQVATEEGFYLP